MTKLAEVVHKGDCYKHKTAVEMFELFKKTIEEICDDKKAGSKVKNYFVKSEESDIPEDPVIENHVKLVDASL